MSTREIEQTLLKEVDTACRNNGLTYVLHGYSLKAYYENADMFNSDHGIHIAMTQGEAEKLVDILEANKGRYLQYSSETSTNYIKWGVDYGVKGTCCFHVNKDVTGDYRGICIRIHYIEKNPETKDLQLLDRYSRQRKMKLMSHRKYKVTRKHRIKAGLANLFENNELLTRKYYRLRTKYRIEAWPDIGENKRVIINRVELKSILLSDVDTVDVNGMTIMIPSNVGEYLRTLQLMQELDINKRGRLTDDVVDYDEIYQELKRRGLVDKAVGIETEITKIKSNIKVENTMINELVRTVKSIVSEEEGL